MTVLEVHEALSGITGSISLTAWIFVLVPQLWENYKLSSAEGISLIFLFVWFIGDLTNLVGSIWARLVPTVVAIAIYFCIADAILILQCLYYKYKNINRDQKSSLNGHGNHSDDPTQPLIRPRTNSNDNIGLPGSRRRSSAAHGRTDSLSSPGLPTIVEEPANLKTWIVNIVALFTVCALGGLGWFAAYKAGAWQPSIEDDTGEAPRPIGAEILGYISAIAYLGARLPQIWKNYKEKSCEGLSLLFFMLSVLGNLTYGASILLHSTEEEYIWKNLPWLIGSLGTIAEDFMIFVQFRLYSKNEDSSALLE